MCVDVDTVGREYCDYDLRIEESLQEKDKTKRTKNDMNLNEIMLSDMINDNLTKHESVSMPGIFYFDMFV